MTSTKFEQAFLNAIQGNDIELQKLVISNNFTSRIEIYRNSVFATLQKTLLKIYCPLEVLLGVDTFHEMTYQYISSNLAHTFNLNQYGADFHDWVKQLPFIDKFPYLPDFVELCYLWQQIYVNPELGVFKITSNYPLYQIWQRCQPEFIGDKEIDDWNGEFSYLIYLENNKVVIKQV
jgi:hypothetical protein